MEFFSRVVRSLGSNVLTWINSTGVEYRIEYTIGDTRHVIENRRNEENGPPGTISGIASAIGSVLMVGTAVVIAGVIQSQPVLCSEDFIDATCTQRVHADTSEINCTVCMDNVKAGEIVRVLPCMHQYHKDCVDEWLRAHGTCPICKHSLVP